jgi:hypothetical protein
VRYEEAALPSPVEKHQVVFLNPDLAGMCTAYLTHRAGADIAVIQEIGRHRERKEGYPHAFPAAGTFHPTDVDAMATEAGFPPPVWERVPRLELHLPDRRISLNSDSGPGGLLIALAPVFPHSRSIWTHWLQERLKKTEELGSGEGEGRTGALRTVEVSVAESIEKLDLFDAQPLLLFLDMLSIVVVGRGIVQLDVQDFPVVLAGLLTGWHMPARGERDWRAILKRRMQKEGVVWREVESITAIQSFGQRMSVVRCSDDSLVGSRVLAVPMGDRFRHPTAHGTSGAIRWVFWYGRARDHGEKEPVVGIVRRDAKRPPINDNLTAFHLRPDLDGAFTVAAPVEERYLAGEEGARLHTIASRTRFLLREQLGWNLDEFESTPGEQLGPDIVLPGTAPSMSYAEGPLWGDDVLTRLRAADRLSRRIVSRLK